MKYRTIGELANAFASGELDKRRTVLLLDNDGSQACFRNTEDESGDVFRGSGYGMSGDLEEALDALGIPWEYV